MLVEDIAGNYSKQINLQPDECSCTTSHVRFLCDYDSSDKYSRSVVQAVAPEYSDLDDGEFTTHDGLPRCNRMNYYYQNCSLLNVNGQDPCGKVV